MTFNISSLIKNVTDEQIGKAHKCFEADGTPFYLVENSQGKLDDDGQLIEYRVTWDREHGFRCTCDAGKEGFIHCHNYCWHVHASVAASEEEKAAMKEQTDFQRQAAMKPAVEPIEKRLNIPQWILTAPVASHMRLSPREF